VLTQKHTLSGEQPGAIDEYMRVRAANAIVTPSNDINGVTQCTRQLGCAFQQPAVCARPHALHFDVTGADEFLILASAALWTVMSHTEAVRRVRPIANALLAAKHLQVCVILAFTTYDSQDMAQSYGYTENLSVIVVRFFFDAQQRAAVDAAQQRRGVMPAPIDIARQIVSGSSVRRGANVLVTT
jgi:serine/threonine protein phosphatase PrpC